MSQLSDYARKLSQDVLNLRNQLVGTEFMPANVPALPEFKETLQDQALRDFVLQSEGALGSYRRGLRSLKESQTAAEKKRLREEEERLRAQQQADKAQQRSQYKLDEAEGLARFLETQERIAASERAGELERIRVAGEEGTRQSIAQLEALYPYLSRAGKEAILQNLDASARFKAFKETLPSSVQAIMESKQKQQQLASDAFYREAMAAAGQQQAASGFAGLGMQRKFG